MSLPATETAEIRRVYLSGPMTGLPELNYPAFRAATSRLREMGFDVYCPTEREPLDTEGLTGNEDDAAKGFDARAAFADYSRYITTEADAVVVLPGWERSVGANAEVSLARAVKLPILDAETLDAVDVPPPGQPRLTAVGNDEVRVTSASGGQKGSKEADYALIPSGPLRELAVLYGRGNIKYPPEPGEMANWKRGYPWSLSKSALLRHLELFWLGEDHDPEMGVKHIICVAWHAFNLAWFIENRPDFDDRPGEDETYQGALPTPQPLLDLLAGRSGAV